MIKKYTSTLLLSGLIYFLLMPLSFASSVSGHVVAPKRVKKVIVYLSRNDKANQNKPVQKHVVSQKNTHFNPALWVISVGDSIEWENNENKEIDHNVFSLSTLERFDLGLGEKGSKLRQQFNKTGILNYYCSVHKEMEGKIVVLPSRHYQLLKKPTAFKISDLPAGEWTLNAIVFHRRYKAEPVKVTIGKQGIKNLTLNIVKR